MHQCKVISKCKKFPKLQASFFLQKQIYGFSKTCPDDAVRARLYTGGNVVSQGNFFLSLFQLEIKFKSMKNRV